MKLTQKQARALNELLDCDVHMRQKYGVSPEHRKILMEMHGDVYTAAYPEDVEGTPEYATRYGT